MTDAEWEACDDPTPMLEFLRARGKLSERKARLFAVAACRRVWHLMTDERTRRAVEVAERYADGAASDEDLANAGEAAPDRADDCRRILYGYWAAIGATYNGGPNEETYGLHHDAYRTGGAYAAAVVSADYSAKASRNAHAAQHDKPQATDAERVLQCVVLRDLLGPLLFQPLPPIEPAVLAWNDGAVMKVATCIYHGRRFGDLPLLADALEDAGCGDKGLLDHLRCPGPHVRGCYAVDAVLGKS